MSKEEPYRIEKDSLGAVQVPANALYGCQTQRAVLNFPISGRKPYKAFIWSIAAIKRAAAEVNCRAGLLNERLAHVICTAAEEVMSGMWDDQFVVDPFQAGAGTSHNMNANEVIANRATILLGGQLGEYLVHPNDHVNMSQSTNDVIPTAIRLGCLWQLAPLLDTVNNLSKALEQKAAAFDGIIKSGRTHLQDAVPIRLGQEFGAYASAVDRDSLRVSRSADTLRRLGIGGTAAGSGLNAPPLYHVHMVKKLSEITHLELHTSDNLFESMQSMADMLDFSAALRTLAVTLGRIANDLRLLSSGPATGIDEIRLPPVQPGSSIMPGKVNPVMAEMLNMAMYHIIGCDTTISLAAQAGQLELNVMMPVIAQSLFEMIHIMTNAIQAFTENCVCGIKANPQKAKMWLQQNPIIITALNPLIGYSAGAALVQEALQSNRPIHEVALAHARLGQLHHRETGAIIQPEEIEKAFANLIRLTEGGIIA